MSETNTTSVTVRVTALHPATPGGKLLALADARIEIHGVEFEVRGFRVTRAIVDGRPGTAVSAPLHRDAQGRWAPAVAFPAELHDPLSDIVLAACLDAGICREVEA